jgi:hypothetical protein
MEKHQNNMLAGDEGDFTFKDSAGDKHKVFTQLLMYNSVFFYNFLSGSFKKDTYDVDSVMVIKPLLYSIQTKEVPKLYLTKNKSVHISFLKKSFYLSLDEVIVYVDYCRQWMANKEQSVFESFLCSIFCELPMKFLLGIYQFVESGTLQNMIGDELYNGICRKYENIIVISDLWEKNSVCSDMLSVSFAKYDCNGSNDDEYEHCELCTRISQIFNKLSAEFVEKKALCGNAKEVKGIEIKFAKIIAEILSGPIELKFMHMDIHKLPLIKTVFTKKQLYYLVKYNMGLFSPKSPNISINRELVDEKIQLICTKRAGEIGFVGKNNTTVNFKPCKLVKVGDKLVDSNYRTCTIVAIRDENQEETDIMIPRTLYSVDIAYENEKCNKWVYFIKYI